MRRFARVAMMGFAWMCFAVGCVGVFVLVVPTAPLLLLATFLFARSSDRCHRWICSTKVYRNYVAVFKRAGGMTLASKARMLAVSYAVLVVSAFAVRKVFVWVVLACVALFLLWLVVLRIATISEDCVWGSRDVGIWRYGRMGFHREFHTE